MVEFGEQLRRAREEKGITQQTLAEQLLGRILLPESLQLSQKYYNNPQELIISIVWGILQIAVLVYGFILSMKDLLIPKKAGMVITIHFALTCVCNFVLNILFTWDNQLLSGRYILMSIVMSLPLILSAIGAYQYFCRNVNMQIWKIMIYIGTFWYAVVAISNAYVLSKNNSGYMPTQMVSSLLFGICLGAIFAYQTFVLGQKRKQVNCV